MFEENIKNFRTRLTSRGYPNHLVDKIISEVKFEERKKERKKERNKERKKERSYTNTESAQQNSTLYDTISAITAMFEKHSNGKMSSNTKPATTKRDIQESSLDLL